MEAGGCGSLQRSGMMFCQDQRAQAGQDNSRITACQHTIAFPLWRGSGQHLNRAISWKTFEKENLLRYKQIHGLSCKGLCVCRHLYTKPSTRSFVWKHMGFLSFEYQFLLVCVWVCLSFCLWMLAYLHVGGSWFVICHLAVTASKNGTAPTCRYNYKIDSHDSRQRFKLTVVTRTGTENRPSTCWKWTKRYEKKDARSFDWIDKLSI